jgi:hypothetical protein
MPSLTTSETAVLDGPTVKDMDELLSSSCPSCGYPGLVIDHEYDAYVHDFCGYWVDISPDPLTNY